MCVIEKGKYDIFIILLDNGAKLDLVDNLGRSVLDYALTSPNLSILQELLIRNCIDINMRNKDGVTQLISAVNRNNLPMVQFLLNNNADINIQDKNGDTALSWAVFNRSLVISTELLKYKPNVNIKEKNGNTPLMIAIKQQARALVQLLLNHPDIDVNATTEADNTPLHAATATNNKHFIELLLAKGANPNSINKKGETPKTLARMSNNKEISKLFRSNMITNSPDELRIKESLVNENKECPICLMPLTIKESVMTPCHHIFCVKCMDQVLKSNSNQVCPNCRADID
jgi:ankyrin repeat protein